MSALIKFDEPVVLPSGKKLEEITITDAVKQCGCLRGLKLFDVLSLDVDSMTVLLSRVTSPNLTEVEVAQLPTPVFTQLVTEVVSFLGGSSPDKETPKSDM